MPASIFIVCNRKTKKLNLRGQVKTDPMNEVISREGEFAIGIVDVVVDDDARIDLVKRLHDFIRFLDHRTLGQILDLLVHFVSHRLQQINLFDDRLQLLLQFLLLLFVFVLQQRAQLF